jgi:hypothetical protein
VVLAVALAAAGVRADLTQYDEAPIHYSATTPTDPATRLQARLTAGEATLDSAGDQFLLLSLLRELKIPVSSQTLVFSKTSLQRNSISPSRPRAVYFNDDTYVGFVPGGRVIEVATTDPNIGTTFYTVDQHPTGPMRLTRQTDNCLQCHASNMTRNFPGLVVRSVHPDSYGEPILPAGTFLTTHESPLSERWGGWYVTSPLPGANMANTTYDESAGAGGSASKPAAVALDPAKAFDASRYPLATSDPVALLVLEHQVEAHNRLTRALYATRRALSDEETIAKAMNEPVPVKEHSESTLRRIHHACDPLVEYLLFAGEPELPAPLNVQSAFAEEFQKRGPRDVKGRSLRDFDLKTRLFRYPCSYLVYTESFDARPTPALEYVYQRLHAVLTGQDSSPAFAHLGLEGRQEILEIIRATKSNLPGYWK